MDEDFDMSSDEGTDIVDDTVQDDVSDEIEDESEDEMLEDESEDEMPEDESEDEIPEDESEEEIPEDESEEEIPEDESEEEMPEDESEEEMPEDESEEEIPEDESEEEIPEDESEEEILEDESEEEIPEDELEDDISEDKESDVTSEIEEPTEETEENVDTETEEGDVETDVEESTEETEEDVVAETEEGDDESDAEESIEEDVDAEGEGDVEPDAEESTEEDVDAETEGGDEVSDTEESSEEDIDIETEEDAILETEKAIEDANSEMTESADKESEENVTTEVKEGEDTIDEMPKDESEKDIQYEENCINDAIDDENGGVRDNSDESLNLLESGNNGDITSATNSLTNSEKYDIATSAAKFVVGIGSSIASGNAVADIPTHVTNAIGLCAKINKAYFKELGPEENEGKIKSLVRPFFEATGKINDMMVAVVGYANASGENINASQKLALTAGMLYTNGEIDKHTMATFKAAGTFAGDVTSVFRKGIPKTPSDVRDKLTKVFDAGKQIENFSKEWLEAKYGTSDIPKEVARTLKMPERVMAWAGRHSAIIKENNEYREAMKEYHNNIKKGIEMDVPTAPERKYSFTDKTLNACGKINDFLSKVKSANEITQIKIGDSETTKIVDYGLDHGINRLVDFSQKHDIIDKFKGLFNI